MAVQHALDILRSLGRSYPRIWRVTEPARVRAMRGVWRARNLITRGKPLVIPVNNAVSVLFHPTGQIAQALWRNDFEVAERDFVAHWVRPGMTALNVGANTGLYCVLLSALVGTTGHVYAFEPSSENCDRLSQNLALNSCRNVTTVQAALADFCGTASLRDDPADAWLDAHRFLVRNGGEGEVVQCMTWDAYWYEANKEALAPLDFMLIDVEGAEVDVLHGARHTIESSPGVTIHVECIQRLDDLADLTKDLDLTCYTWNSGDHRLEPAEIHKGNLIFRRSGL